LSVSVSGASTAQISINGGAWTTSGSISSGQSLQVRLTSSGLVSTGQTATVTVGSTSTNWTVTTQSGSLQVFVTSGTYVGSSLGGLSGADADCVAAASAAGYSGGPTGTWKAILSSDTTSAASRLTLSYPIVRASDGTTVSTVNLWNGSLSNSFATGEVASWTGSTSTGGINAGYTCSSWSSTSSFAYWGDSVATDTSWIACNNSDPTGCYHNWNGATCNSAQHLMCIQQ
jgi:hypothetical protein